MLFLSESAIFPSPKNEWHIIGKVKLYSKKGFSSYKNIFIILLPTVSICSILDTLEKYIEFSPKDFIAFTVYITSSQTKSDPFCHFTFSLNFIKYEFLLYFNINS